MIFRNIMWTALIIVIFAFLGCSSGNPIDTGIKVIPDIADNGLPVFVTDSDQSIIQGRGLLGAFELNIDPSIPSAEIVPLRSISKEGDSFKVDLNYYFTVVPCKECLKVEGVSIDGSNNLNITIRTTHPFPTADLTKAPSGKNRDDLRIFDVKLIVFTEGEKEFPNAELMLNPGVVANADGYTTLEDPILDSDNNVDTNAFPYIILAEDPTEGNVSPSSATGFTDLVNATGHNVLNQGKSYVDTLVINLAYGGAINAKLFMFGSYGQTSQNLTDRLTPTYWLPELNQKEPWKVGVEVTENNLNTSSAFSDAHIEVSVWDWQHSNTKVDPNLATLDSIKGTSAVSSVSVEIPGLLNNDLVSDTPSGGNGLNTSPLKYGFDLTNESLAAAGNYWGLVKITDNRHQGLNWGAMGELVDFDPASGLRFIKIYEFATYQVFPISVADTGPPPCGPITSRIQYGKGGGSLGFLTGSEIHVLDTEEWIIKVQPTVPNGNVTEIKFDFDDPNFDDQTGTEVSIRRAYNNPNCAQYDPFELNLTITITDDCAASADWTKTLTIFIHCGDPCGPIIPGLIFYSVNGGLQQNLPSAGVTIQNNDELEVKAPGFQCTDGTITKIIFDFSDPNISDQSGTNNTVTRVIPHPTCSQAGADPYTLTVTLTVQDDCPLTLDWTKTYPITVECPPECGPITGGQIEYSQDGSPFVMLPGNMVSVMSGAEIAFKMAGYTSANANITEYSFQFDNPNYTGQTGTSDTITNTYTNPNCSGGTGDLQYVTLSYRIKDDCQYSPDITGEITVQIVCTPCYGVGLSFTQSHLPLATTATFDTLDISKAGGGGLKISTGAGGYLYAGYIGRKIAGSQPGIGFGWSNNNADTWALSQFIPTPNMPGGFSIVTADALNVVVAWFDSTDGKIHIERSINGGIQFTRTEVYDSQFNIRSISMVQDPNNSDEIYIAFVEANDSTESSNTIKILRSTDMGLTFPQSLTRTAYSSTQVYGRKFVEADLAISPINGDVYLAAAQSGIDGSNIFVARSTNGADSFNAGGKVLSNIYTSTIDTVEIAVTEWDRDGQGVYVAYAQGTSSIGFVKLIKGNVSMDSFEVINTAINDTTNKRPYEADLAIDMQGNVYVAWSDNRAGAGKSDIYTDYSSDGGYSFNEDTITSDATPGTGARTSPEILMAQGTCQKIVMWEDDAGLGVEIFTRKG